MPMDRNETLCSICRRPGIFTTCSGCRAPLCEDCAHFELHGHGCGTVIPLYLCPTCVRDPLQNPCAALRDPEE